jgi:acetyl-CoA C-acetyltransferase
MPRDNTPILIGVGQVTEKDPELAVASSPLDLMVQATRLAFDNAGLNAAAASEIDALVVVRSFREPMRNTPEAFANALHATQSKQWIVPDGGYAPQYLVNRFSEAITRGEHQMVLLTGAEAMATGRKIVKSGAKIPWDVPSDTDPETLYDVPEMWNDHERQHGVWQASHVYPLFENALRQHLGRGLTEHQNIMGEIFSRLSEVATTSAHAWFSTFRSPAEIANPSASNRYVGWPYTKYMNAMNQVNQSASVVLTSVGHARELGVDESRWAYLHGCADVTEIWELTQRVNYFSSPAINLLGKETLSMAGISIDDIEHIDLYSCFPSAVQIACAELGIAADDPRPLTVTGGLPFHGGAGNNYVMNSIAAMVDKVRAAPSSYGLVTANGGFLGRHSAGIYSTRPVEDDWVRKDPATYQPQIDNLKSPAFTETPVGEARIESYSIVFGRSNEPESGIVIGRLGEIDDPGATRFIANLPDDEALLRAMTEKEYVNAKGTVQQVNERNIFTPTV